MKLIATEAGRVTWLFPLEEVRPLRGVGIRVAVSIIAERYDFISKPTFDRPWKEIEDKPLEFKEGTFTIDGEAIPVGGLSVYTDGIAIQCRTTEDAELVYADLIQYGTEKLGLRAFQRTPLKIPFSSVVVQFEKPISGLLKGWSTIQKVLGEPMKRIHGMDAPEVVRFGFHYDPKLTIGGAVIGSFGIERRKDEPFADNRWFCHGPLPTNELVKMLEQLEQLV